MCTCAVLNQDDAAFMRISLLSFKHACSVSQPQNSGEFFYLSGDFIALTLFVQQQEGRLAIAEILIFIEYARSSINTDKIQKYKIQVK